MPLLSMEGRGLIRCQIGEHEVEAVATNSIRNYPPLACVACLKALGRWCTKHDAVHTWFLTGASSCIPCIEEETERSEAVGGELLQEILPSLPTEELEEFSKWLDLVTDLTETLRGRCFARALATEAACRRVPLQTIINEVRRRRSVAWILPYPFGNAGNPFGPPPGECDV